MNINGSRTSILDLPMSSRTSVVIESMIERMDENLRRSSSQTQNNDPTNRPSTQLPVQLKNYSNHNIINQNNTLKTSKTEIINQKDRAIFNTMGKHSRISLGNLSSNIPDYHKNVIVPISEKINNMKNRESIQSRTTTIRKNTTSSNPSNTELYRRSLARTSCKYAPYGSITQELDLHEITKMKLKKQKIEQKRRNSRTAVLVNKLTGKKPGSPVNGQEKFDIDDIQFNDDAVIAEQNFKMKNDKHGRRITSFSLAEGELEKRSGNVKLAKKPIYLSVCDLCQKFTSQLIQKSNKITNS